MATCVLGRAALPFERPAHLARQRALTSRFRVEYGLVIQRWAQQGDAGTRARTYSESSVRRQAYADVSEPSTLLCGCTAQPGDAVGL